MSCANSHVYHEQSSLVIYFYQILRLKTFLHSFLHRHIAGLSIENAPNRLPLSKCERLLLNNQRLSRPGKFHNSLNSGIALAHIETISLQLETNRNAVALEANRNSQNPREQRCPRSLHANRIKRTHNTHHGRGQPVHRALTGPAITSRVHASPSFFFLHPPCSFASPTVNMTK